MSVTIRADRAVAALSLLSGPVGAVVGPNAWVLWSTRHRRFTDVADVPKRPTAIVLGTEHRGLTTELLAGTDLAVGIPMHGAGDSLNVSTSAAIILYEAVRQRTAARKV